jgi:hypothetical protein
MFFFLAGVMILTIASICRFRSAVCRRVRGSHPMWLRLVDRAGVCR